MAVVSDIEIRLRADIARLQTDMNAARRSVDGAMGGITRAVGAAKSAFFALAAGMGVGQLANFTDQYTKFTAQLKLATNSQKEYAQAVEDVKRISTSAQNDIGATGVLYARIIASTRELGVAQSQVAKVTETVNLALAATGAGAGESASAMLQLSQAFGSGVLRGEEFNAVYEAAPELLRILARDMDVPIGKLRKLAEEGKLTSDKLVKAFSNNAVIQGLRDNVAQITTISGAVTVFKNNLIEIIGTEAQTSGAVKLVTTSILGAAGAVKTLAEGLGGALKVAAAYFAAFVAAPVVFQFAATAMGNLRLQIALAKLEMANGATVASLFSGSIGGVGIAAQWASGMLGKLTIATNLAFAAFAGWELGKYLESQFVEVEIAAEVMTGELLKAWSLMKFAFKDAFDAITLTAREGVAALTRGFGGWFGLVADGLRMIGKTDAAEELDKFAGRMVKATEVAGTFAARSAGRRAEFEKEIKQIDLDTNRRSTNALMRGKLVEAAGRESAATGAAAAKSAEITKAQIAAAKKLAEAYADLMAKLEERVAVTAREVAGLAPLTEAEKAHLALTDEIAKKKVVLTAAQEARARSLINEAGANDVLIKSNKDYADLQQLLADNAKDLAAERYSLIESAKQEAEQNEMAAKTFGMAEAAIIRLNAARLIEQETQRLGRSLTEDEIADLNRVIALKERSAQAAAARAELEAVKTFWTDIEKTAHDTFVSIADGGKNAFKRLKDTARNTFFDWLYQMTLKKWIINIGTSVAGAGAVSGIANAAGAASGGMSLSGIGTLGSGFLGSLAGGLEGITGTAAMARMGLTSEIGLGIGNSIAGVIGPNVASGIATGLSGLAAAAPWAAGALAIFSLGKKAFGRGPKEYTGDQTLNGSLSGGGFSGMMEADWVKKGGWFRSDKKDKDRLPVDAAVSQSLGQAYSAIQTSSADFARVLGANADSIMSRSQSIRIALGKDEAANQKAIADFFVGVADTIAREIVPNIDQFRIEGEAAATTLQRVTTNFAGVNVVLEQMGITSQQAFGAVGVASIAARERLIAFAGGLDSLAAQTAYFNENFIDEGERVAIAQRELQSRLAALGYSGLTTADQFRQAVQGLAQSGALATESGARTYAGLLALAPAFKTVTDYLNELNEAARQTLRDRAGTAIDALSRAVDIQKDQVSKAFTEMMGALETGIDGANDAIERTSDLSRTLRESRIRVESDTQLAASRQSAQAQIASAIAIARASGVLPSTEDLRDALSTLNQDASGQFSSLADYQREVARTNNQLFELGGITDEQLGIAERQLKALQDQQTAVQTANERELLRLDGLVSAAQSELAAIENGRVATLSVAEAVYRVDATLRELDYNVNGSRYIEPPVFYAPPTQASTMQSNEAMLMEMRTMNGRLASAEVANMTTAEATRQLAAQFNRVSGGGETLLIQQA